MIYDGIFSYGIFSRICGKRALCRDVRASGAGFAGAGAFGVTEVGGGFGVSCRADWGVWAGGDCFWVDWTPVLYRWLAAGTFDWIGRGYFVLGCTARIGSGGESGIGWFWADACQRVWRFAGSNGAGLGCAVGWEIFFDGGIEWIVALRHGLYGDSGGIDELGYLGGDGFYDLFWIGDVADAAGSAGDGADGQRGCAFALAEGVAVFNGNNGGAVNLAGAGAWDSVCESGAGGKDGCGYWVSLDGDLGGLAPIGAG